MTARARATKADMAKAIRAAHGAPVPCVVEITPDGTIRIVRARTALAALAQLDKQP